MAARKLVPPRRGSPDAGGRHETSRSVSEHQDAVNAYFAARAPRLEESYTGTDLNARFYRRRQSIVLSTVDSLALPLHSRALEIGCGPGLTTVCLARHGLIVDAIDPVDAMVRQTRRRAVDNGLTERVRASLGDARRLEFGDETFRLVVAIGVTGWLSSVEQPLREIARVLEPGGFLLVNTDNRWALHQLLDPGLNPLFEPLKVLLARLRTRLRRCPDPPQGRTYSIRQFDALLAAAGLEKAHGLTLGFGPFSFFRRTLLSDDLGAQVDQKLRSWASRFPILRSGGQAYLVLARKPVAYPEAPDAVMVREDTAARMQAEDDPRRGEAVPRDLPGLALEWFDRLKLRSGSPVLEVGCGTDSLAVALAKRGYIIEAIDTAQDRVDETRRAAEQAGVAHRIRAHTGEVENLTMPPELFDLVLALGALSGRFRPERALREMTRVLKPGGCLILSADNSWALNRLLGGERRRLAGQFPPRRLDALLRAHGLEKQRGTTTGFGPFPRLGWRRLSDAQARSLESRLERICGSWPLLRRAGAHYIVLARKATP